MTLEGDQAVDISYHFLRKKRLVFDVFGRTCYSKTTIVWMVAKSCTTLDGWNPMKNGMFTIYQLVITGFRWPIHRMLVGNSMVLGGQIFPWGTSIRQRFTLKRKGDQRFEGTSFDGFHWGFPPVMPDILAFWGLDLSDIRIFLDIDWI